MDRVAGERPFLSFAVVCFWRDAGAFALAGERLLPLLPVLWRTFDCRPVVFGSGGGEGDVAAGGLGDDECSFSGEMDGLIAGGGSSTSIDCSSFIWLATADVPFVVGGISSVVVNDFSSCVSDEGDTFPLISLSFGLSRKIPSINREKNLFV